MTSRLRQVVSEIECLPADAQDAIAERLRLELADSQEWAKRFAATTDEQWAKIAAEVRREISADTTDSLRSVISPPK